MEEWRGKKVTVIGLGIEGEDLARFFAAGGASVTASDAKPQGDAKSVGSSGANDGEKAMTAKFIPVEIGIRDGDAVELVAGIHDGIRVITTGAGALKDGDRVVASTGSDSGRPAAPSTADNGAQKGTRQ